MDNPQSPASSKRFGCLHVLLVIIIILLVAILGSIWWLKRNMYASEFTPVELDANAQQVLDTKLNAVDPAMSAFGTVTPAKYPEIYTETDQQRKIIFSQDELNAVLAKDAELARRVKFHLSDQLVSVQFLVPMEQEIPIVGGKTFKLNMGLSLSYTNQAPIVIVRGISVGGVPLPGAWWGDIKNKNLVQDFGQPGGFWDMFSKGVEFLEVKDGQFILHLKE